MDRMPAPLRALSSPLPSLPMVLLLLLLGLGCAGARPATTPPPPTPSTTTEPDATVAARRLHYDQQIFAAVLSGLYRDGVANEVVDAVTAIDGTTHWPAHFVYACPICMPAFDAFRTYRARPTFFGDKQHRDTFGPGLSVATTAALCGADAKAVQQTLQELVQSWLAARERELRLTPAERAEWAAEMEQRRQQGTKLLVSFRQQGLGANYSWMQACPLCEAAHGACERP